MVIQPTGPRFWERHKPEIPDTALQDISLDADIWQYPDGTIERRANGTPLPFMTDDRLFHPRTSP